MRAAREALGLQPMDILRERPEPIKTKEDERP